MWGGGESPCFVGFEDEEQSRRLQALPLAPSAAAAVATLDEHHTLPRNYKAALYQPLSPSFQKFAASDANKRSATPTLARRAKAATLALDDDEDDEEEDDEHHLKPMRFGPTPKSFNSNPELAGPRSARSPLIRSNAQRKRDVAPVHMSQTEPAALDEAIFRVSQGLFLPLAVDCLRACLCLHGQLECVKSVVNTISFAGRFKWRFRQ